VAGERKIRIGIDVGGTFTHAVAIDAATLDLVGKSKVPTTHEADEGVARGVVESLTELMTHYGIAPREVILIAHSTTQATNALLEGDVAPVGIVAMAAGLGTWLARVQTAIRPVDLGAGRRLPIVHRFVPSGRVNRRSVDEAIESLVAGGAEVIVAAEAFSVDDPSHETLVCERAAERGVPATATHHVSRLHGLGMRTRTAVINACMIPRMLATANMTEKAVRDAGITAPIMIMRSDGGVMDIEEMRRRPILTMLSGPAAGVAAALLYARVSDGVFIEVGGTSTDVSVIRNGRCEIRAAEVGGQKLHVSTLDVRTAGLAGGSMVTVRDGRIRRVGPRSAHIVGAPYLSFCESSDSAFEAATLEHDGEQYIVVQDGAQSLAVTPTCASNLLGLVPEGDCAKGRQEAIDRGFDVLARRHGYADGAALADAIMSQTVPGIERLVNGFIANYKLDRGVLRLVAGGGGGSAIVPYLARRMNLPCETVENADVISAIGVALALVRDTVERTVIDPGEDDIRQVRAEVVEAVLRMGAIAETVDVFVEVDAKRNLLRATAQGSTQIREQQLRAAELDEEQRAALVAASLGPSLQAPKCIIRAAGFEVWAAPRDVPRLWRLYREQRQGIRVLDRAGAIRWASNHADAFESNVGSATRDLESFAEQYTRYSDAGATIPRCFVLIADRMIDLSGLVEMKQVLDILQLELGSQRQDTDCVLLVERGGR
jgi:N-methylhydantoinase A/oxoprolinase/acetone carboxylase beta subunit